MNKPGGQCWVCFSRHFPYGLSRIYAIKPRMDTDEHGLRPDKKFLWQTRKASLIGGLVCPAEINFFIRVYLCPSVVKNVFAACIRLTPHVYPDDSVSLTNLESALPVP